MAFLEAFDKFCGVQGLLAMSMTIAVIVLTAQGKIVPPEMYSLLGVGWGFYFAKNGSKILSSTVSSIKSKGE